MSGHVDPYRDEIFRYESINQFLPVFLYGFVCRIHLVRAILLSLVKSLQAVHLLDDSCVSLEELLVAHRTPSCWGTIYI